MGSRVISLASLATDDRGNERAKSGKGAWPGKSSGAFAFALTFSNFFVKKKVDRTSSEKSLIMCKET
jgi:hypothetical protein